MNIYHFLSCNHIIQFSSCLCRFRFHFKTFHTYSDLAIKNASNISKAKKIIPISSYSEFFSRNSWNDSFLEQDKTSILSLLESSEEPLYKVLCPYVDDNNDSFINSLRSCASIQEVNTILRNYDKTISPQQACQIIFSFSHIKNMRQFQFINSLEHLRLNASFYNSLESEPKFMNALSIVKENLNVVRDRAPALMLCLDNLNIALHDDIMVKLYVDCLNQIPHLDIHSLIQLSFVFNDKGIKGSFIQSKMLKKFSNEVLDCNSVMTIFWVSLFYLNSKKLISKENFARYEFAISKLINDGQFINLSPNFLLIVLKTLSHFSKSNPSWDSVMYLLKQFSDKIPDLTVHQLIILNYFLLIYFEPRDIIYKVHEQASRLMEECSSPSLRIELLLCMSLNSKPKMRNYYELLAAEEIYSVGEMSNISSFYRIIRYIKTNNTKLCNQFWDKALHNLRIKLSDTNDLNIFGENERKLFHVYGRYVFFNSNLGGQFRHRVLEREIISKIQDEIKGCTRHSPTKVAHMLGFMISYSDEDNISMEWFDLLKRIHCQLNIYDVGFLSNGINLKRNQNICNKKCLLILLEISSLLDRISEQLVQQCSSLSEAAILMTAYRNRQNSALEPLFYSICEKHIQYIAQINSKLISQMLRNFKIFHYIIPEVYEKVSYYVVKNESNLLGLTVYMVLSCFYALGYSPTNIDEFSVSSCRIIETDCERMTCSFLIESCLSLCNYKALSSELIHHIFSVEFLDQLEEEIMRAYSKNFAFLAKKNLMKLNRAVCIDYPEEKIPWFHEKYCRDQSEFDPSAPTNFQRDVKRILGQMLGHEDLISMNIKSPYHYNIDLEFILNRCGEPVHPHSISRNVSDGPKNRFKRIAVLLRNELCYSSDYSTLNGECQLQRRHLEILGYNVVEVPQHAWYSMAIGTDKDKYKLLKSLIYQELSRAETNSI